ncbi:hypothetical protein KR084_007929, partial [Drosophila pseudotakahashii]
PSDMSATTRSRIWHRQSSSRVAESALIGDGPHVQRIRHHRPHPPTNQRMLVAADQRPRAPTPRRNYLLRKISLQRSLAFYSRLRSTFGFAYLFDSDFSMSRQLRVDSHRPMLGNWAGLPNEIYEGADDDVDIQQRRFFSERHHWDRAQLYFQQYLGLPHRHHHSPKSFSLKCELNLKFIGDALYGICLTEALRLAFNEMLHLH